MGSNPLVALKRQLKEIDGQIKRLQSQRDKIEKILGDAEQLSAEVDADLGGGSSGPSGNGGSSASRKRTGGMRPAEITNAAKDILAEAEKPLTRGDLLKEFERLGFEIGGDNPANKLGTTLSRNDDKGGPVTHIKEWGYWLRSRNFPPAGYIAEEDRETVGEAPNDNPPVVH